MRASPLQRGRHKKQRETNVVGALCEGWAHASWSRVFLAGETKKVQLAHDSKWTTVERLSTHILSAFRDWENHAPQNEVLSE